VAGPGAVRLTGWRLPAVLALLAVLAAAAAARATVQDASSYPAGVAEVSNTPVLAAQDFAVRVRLADGVDAGQVAVTVCHFKAIDAPGPDVCYMNLGAEPAGNGSYAARTSAVRHPDWRDGAVVGYKVTLQGGAGDAHAPDRTTASGEQDYYRVVVGSPQPDPQPQGSAVVEDLPTMAPQASQVHASPFPFWAAVSVLAGVALLRRTGARHG